MTTERTHIGESERWLSVIAGAMLALSSLRRRDLGTGALFALAGSGLMFRGLTGRDDFLETVGGALERQLSGSDHAPRGDGQGAADGDYGRASDDVEEASMESFPASDPPSWTPTAGADIDGDIGDEGER